MRVCASSSSKKDIDLFYGLSTFCELKDGRYFVSLKTEDILDCKNVFADE